MEIMAGGRDLFDPDDEIVITSILPVKDGLFLSGSKKEKHYDVILIKINASFNIEFTKQFGDQISDYEGQDMIIQDDGLLISGCSEGYASPDGGRDWKAYLLKTTRAGIKEWERSFRILGNECAYNVISNDNILLFGDTKNDTGKAQFFLMSLDQEGKLDRKQLYGEGTGTVSCGILSINDDLIIIGCIKKDDIWRIIIYKVDKNGEIEWEKMFSGYYILEMRELSDGFLLTGKRSGQIFLMKVDLAGNMVWESTFDEGTGVSIATVSDHIFLGADLEVDKKSQPVIYKLDISGKLIEKLNFEKEGWIETMTEFQGSLIAIRIGTHPKEHSELIQIKI